MKAVDSRIMGRAPPKLGVRKQRFSWPGERVESSKSPTKGNEESGNGLSHRPKSAGEENY